MGQCSFRYSQSLKHTYASSISMVNSSRAPGETNAMVLFSEALGGDIQGSKQ